MSILRGTTPTVVLVLPSSVDLSSATKGWMSFGQKEQGRDDITDVFDVPFGRLTLSGNRASAVLSQAETLKLDARFPTVIQLRWESGGIAKGTYPITVDTIPIIKEGAI